MKNGTNVNGVGCFAKGNTLQRMFRKVLENFILLKYEDICPPSERLLNNNNVKRFFSSVIRYGTERPDQMDRASELVFAATKINGFYLGLNEQSLQLIVFLQNAGFRRTRFITRLDKFTRLRQNRLH